MVHIMVLLTFKFGQMSMCQWNISIRKLVETDVKVKNIEWNGVQVRREKWLFLTQHEHMMKLDAPNNKG